MKREFPKELSFQRRFLFSILTLFLSILLCLALAELIVRNFLQLPAYSTANNNGYELKAGEPPELVPDELLGFKPGPGWTGSRYDYDDSKEEDFKKKVLLFGDSIMTYNQPELAIKNLLPETDFQIKRVGIGNYNTRQEALFFEHHVRLRPDIVILGFCLNDFMPSLSVVSKDNNFKVVKNLFEPIGAVNPYLWARSALYRYLKLRTITVPSLDWSWSPAAVQAHREGVRDSLKKMHDLAKERGSDFVVILYPHFVEDPDPYLKAAYRAALGILQELEIDYSDVTEAYRQAGFENMKISPNDIHHPNLLGHQIAFKQLFAEHPEKFFGQNKK